MQGGHNYLLRSLNVISNGDNRPLYDFLSALCGNNHDSILNRTPFPRQYHWHWFSVCDRQWLKAELKFSNDS